MAKNPEPRIECQYHQAAGSRLVAMGFSPDLRSTWREPTTEKFWRTLRSSPMPDPKSPNRRNRDSVCALLLKRRMFASAESSGARWSDSLDFARVRARDYARGSCP
jgi:hypothetical protein